MANRRQFLTTVSALASSLAAKGRLHAAGSTAPRVQAAASVFYAQPDGARNLIRFTITGLESPAGRLRAFDRGRLLGTAGVLRRGDSLVGELWLPVPRDGRITTQLEAPDLRAPLRTAHQLQPPRRWTVHVVSIVDPQVLADELDALPPIRRAVRTSMLLQHRVSVNPIPSYAGSDHLDHLALLRVAAAAQDVELRYGVPVSPIAVPPEGRSFPRSLVGALSGTGVSALALTPPAATRMEYWEAWEAARVLALPMPAGGDPVTLGFHESLEEMMRSVERWLTTTPLFLSPEYRQGVAVAVATAAAMAPLSRIDEWNGRYAYPRIVLSDAVQLLGDVAAESVTVPTAPARAIGTHRDDPYDAVADGGTARVRQVSERTAQLVAALSAVLPSRVADVSGVAAAVPAVTPGTLVFNTSPYVRSELVRMGDGTERLATDVPGLGFAYFPDAAPLEEESRQQYAWVEAPRVLDIDGGSFRIELNSWTGSIESLVDHTTGREWVSEGSGGLNAVAGARVERVTRRRLPGVAHRLDVVRWASGGGTVRTEITVYDDLPWLDIVNETEAAGRESMEYEFPWSLAAPQVSWEVPAGFESRAAPVERLSHLRWLHLASPPASVLLRGLDAPWATVDEHGRLTSHAHGGRSRFRISVHGYGPEPDFPWIFGWNAEPLETAPVAPKDAGPLPRFGTLLKVDPVGVAVLGLLPAQDGIGLVLYVQDLIGVGRRIEVAPGVVRFSGARRVDYLERDLGEELGLNQGRLSIPLPAGGVSAVRLLGVELNGG